MERGDMTMIIDEAHWLCDPFHIPAPLFEALALGRFERLNTIYVTQSWSMVHRLLTRNSHEFFFWRIIEPSDLNGIRERCGADVAERVSSLRRAEDHRPEGGEFIPGEMLHWTVWNGIEEPESDIQSLSAARQGQKETQSVQNEEKQERESSVPGLRPGIRDSE
jgi:hypothetical protein